MVKPKPLNCSQIFIDLAAVLLGNNRVCFFLGLWLISLLIEMRFENNLRQALILSGLAYQYKLSFINHIYMFWLI